MLVLCICVGDLVFVGSPTATSTQIGDYIIGKITQIITNPANPTIVVADAGTGLNTNKTFTTSDSAFDAGNTVRRLIKHEIAKSSMLSRELELTLVPLPHISR